MNRKAYASILASIFLAISFLTSCGSGSATAPTIAITATSGGGQNGVVSVAFANPLVATVTSNGTGMSGVTVTFTAPPQTGASGTFAGGANRATTNASGVAISAVFTANGIAGTYTVTASTAGTTSTASFSETNKAAAPAAIKATGGTPQSATVLKQFTNPLQAMVVDSNSNPVSGVLVTFTAPPQTGASGTFAGGANTATTNASGMATSAVFTANGTAGPYTVTATVGALAPANFSLTNTAGPMIAATGGTPQTVQVNQPFAMQLQATVTQGGVGVSGVTVTFTAPAQTGASGTFAGGVNTATTNASGVATSAVFTANGIAGTYAVTATAPGVSGTASFSLTNTAAPMIAATGGTPQTVQVNQPFAMQLQATVTAGGVGVSGVTVTFTAPAQTGASGTFAGGVNTATTNASGVATSAVFTANGIAGTYAVTATAPGVSGTASFSLTNTAAPMIAATGGTPQTVQVNQPFAMQLQATVTAGGVGVSGVTVTFTAPAQTGASGTFAGGVNTATTNASGVATSAVFTANGIAGTYAVTATAPGVSGTADFSLTNTAVPTYAFYLSGMEAINYGPNFYAVAGSVAIDVNGNVLYGEQDYNDAFGITATDLILPGSAALKVDPATGQGTLTLTTNDILLGPGGSGIETVGVQFVNNSHALIVQFDESATSSGSLDLQTAPSTPLPGNASYAFTLSGVDDICYCSVVYGGVFSTDVPGTTLTGVYDVDDVGAATATVLGTTFSGAAISPPDGYGRGTITGTGLAGTLAYYIVGPEAIRIIDMDANDSAFGSGFGQGTKTFTNTSLVSSVFAVQSNSFGFSYLGPFAAAGSFTIPAAGTFTGIGDDDEIGFVATGTTIGGSYSISNAVGGTTYNGYGSLTFLTPLQDITNLGIYMTDPKLNLNDPNNMSSGLGGALVADLDGYTLNGTGVLIPQTDTSPSHFTGSTGTYAFGAQDYFVCYGCEFDFVGQGSFAAGAFSGTGLLNDVFDIFGSGLPDSGVTFSGTPVPDTTPPGSSTGRYTLFTPNYLLVTVAGSSGFFDVVIYQASGGQLFWLNEDEDTLFLGPLEQQGSLAGVPGVKRSAAKSAKPKYK